MALIDTKIALPSTGGGVNKNGTPVITGTNGYGDYFTITGVNNTPTTPISVGNTSPAKTATISSINIFFFLSFVGLFTPIERA